MTVLTKCHFCFLLVLLTVFRETRGDLKICTTVDCPNDHIEVQDGANGAIHRYSKNAANFHEAKVSPSSAKTVQHRGHENHSNTKTAATAQRQHSTLSDGHTIHQQPHVSVLGDGGRRDQKLHWQHKQQVREPQLQPHSSNKHLQQQHHQHQHQQQQRQVNPNHLQHSIKDPSGHIQSSGEKHATRNVTGTVHAVEGGIFWSATVESAIPLGLSDTVTETWKKRIRQLRVVKVENASLDKCGSNMNRHVVFDDGTSACARYRHPMVQFVLGDLYCYYLARMLGMQNVPTVVFSHVSNDSSSQWSSVAADISMAGWKNNTVASFSLWINGLGNSHLPEIMYDHQRETIYPSTPGLADLNITELVELAQYSDLIVFDYITAHLDRMTIRKNAVEYYQQDWLYGGEIHNLAKHKTNRGLWFIDNENGIFNAYVTAYSPASKEQMLGYHEELLRSFCIFRRSTYDKVHELASMEDPFEVLDQLVHANEPVVVVEYNKNLFINVNERFKKRLSNVVDWMDNCQSRSSD